MIVLGALSGLILGFAFGGSLDRLLGVRLRFGLLIAVALVLRFGTQFALTSGIALADTLRLPLFAAAFGILAVALWLNRGHPGLSLVAVGVVANGIAITVTGGWMPVYLPALGAAGLTPADVSPILYVALPTDLGLDFLLHAGPLGDLVPFPVPLLANLVSIGDVAVAAGLAWFLFATVTRGRIVPLAEGGVSMLGGRPDLVRTAAFDRPMVLGSARGAGYRAPGGPEAGPAGLGSRIRTHPYVRLARDGRFSDFWLGQTISLFGDRLHQVALGVLVLASTGSAFATGLVFLAATLPNLILGPIAGTFVDRWDHKRVLVVSDLLRAAMVLAIPPLAKIDIALVYPLVFAITSVSLFFRPAKAVVVPRLVSADDLLAANSAVWTGETFADIAGYPLAGLFIAFLGADLALAFWVDSATYLISAVLIVGITIPAMARAASPHVTGAIRAFIGELRDGWSVLRDQPVLFQNTLVSTFAQLSVGATIALTVVYAQKALDGTLIPYPQNFAAIETAIGVGNLLGGVAVGTIGARMRKGRMVVAGFLVMGISTTVLGLTGNVAVALAAAGISGIANLVYVIPSQTLFAQLTPPGYMGRVVAFRSTLVFGAMTGAMFVAGVLAEVLPVGLVIALSGLVTIGAALVGWLLPAVRDA
ncbi:MAG: MFS transporter [Candidatus Limnocylindrales bacterium]